MNNNVETYGTRKPGDVAEVFGAFYRDTLVFRGEGTKNASTATIKDTRLFWDESKGRALLTAKLPLEAKKITNLTHLVVTHNLQFATIGDLFTWENFTEIEVVKDDKVYTKIPVAMFLTYARHRDGLHSTSTLTSATTTTVAQYETLCKDYFLTKLYDSIEVPADQSAVFELYMRIPGGSMTTDSTANGTTLPAGMVAGMASDEKVYWINFIFAGKQQRKA